MLWSCLWFLILLVFLTLDTLLWLLLLLLFLTLATFLWLSFVYWIHIKLLLTAEKTYLKF
jgi:hypothetical protein